MESFSGDNRGAILVQRPWLDLSSQVGQLLLQQGLTLGTMESCTGGLLSSSLTDIAGSSAYVFGGIISYATELKVRIGVPKSTIDDFGVISAQTAAAMADAVRRYLSCDLGIGITGVAGPDRQDNKPPGEVYIGIASLSSNVAHSFAFNGDRLAVKEQAVIAALNILLDHLRSSHHANWMPTGADA